MKMELSSIGRELIKKFEGCKLTSYKCSAGVWTIGYGNTQYENGKYVSQGDKITQEYADKLFLLIVKDFELMTSKLITSVITQNQFDSLVSFCYNVGVGNLKTSTLLKKVNINPNDITIKDEFMKWNKANKKVIEGLTKRRREESNLYFLQLN